MDFTILTSIMETLEKAMCKGKVMLYQNFVGNKLRYTIPLHYSSCCAISSYFYVEQIFKVINLYMYSFIQPEVEGEIKKVCFDHSSWYLPSPNSHKQVLSTTYAKTKSATMT